MENDLRYLIFLGACALLAPEVDRQGFDELADTRVAAAVGLAQKVWEHCCDENL